MNYEQSEQRTVPPAQVLKLSLRDETKHIRSLPPVCGKQPPSLPTCLLACIMKIRWLDIKGTHL